MRKRNIECHVRFNEAEYEIIKKNAQKKNWSVAMYVRSMAIQGEVKIYDMKELQNLLNAFRRIGTNVNQIATVANASGSVYQKDIEDMQEQFKYFDNVMKNYLRELKPKVLL